MRSFSQEEWNTLIALHPPGTSVTGEVVHCALFGVFVRIDKLPEVISLLEVIHFGIRSAAPKHRIEFPKDYPAVGTRIKARILAWSFAPKDVRLTQLDHLDWS